MPGPAAHPAAEANFRTGEVADPVPDAQPVEQRQVHRGDELAAHLAARKCTLFDNGDGAPLGCQGDSGRGPGRTASDDDRIISHRAAPEAVERAEKT